MNYEITVNGYSYSYSYSYSHSSKVKGHVKKNRKIQIYPGLLLQSAA